MTGKDVETGEEVESDADAAQGGDAGTAALPLTTFNFESHDLRTVERDGEPWFLLQDVCEILEVQNPGDMAKRIPDDERRIDSIYMASGHRKVTLVSEAGFYRVVVRSRKPAAERFMSWVVKVVLPSIRKTGAYRLPSSERGQEFAPSAPVDDGTAEILGAVRDLLRHHDVGGSLDIAMRLRHDSSQSVLKIHKMIDEWRKGQAEAKAGDDWKVEALRKARLDLAELTAGRLAIPDDQLVGVTVAGRMVAILFNRRAFAAFAEEHLQALAASTRRWTGVRLVVLLRGATAETRASWERWAALEPDVLIESEAEASRGTHASFAFVPLTFEGCDRSSTTETPSGPSR